MYVLKTDIPWGLLPEEFECSGVTCWRRLRDWQKAGVFAGFPRARRELHGVAAEWLAGEVSFRESVESVRCRECTG